jgi:hypothetical protein
MLTLQCQPLHIVLSNCCFRYFETKISMSWAIVGIYNILPYWYPKQICTPTYFHTKISPCLVLDFSKITCCTVFKIPHSVVLVSLSPQEHCTGIVCSPGSSVTSDKVQTVGSGVQILACARDFSLLQNVQAGSGAHPASYSMDTWCSFPRAKAARAWA